MEQKDKDENPKERLLDEAEALFARKGYDAVTVREITQAAGCNLAAVNYHFGNKRNLYMEVFRARWIPRARRLRESFENSLPEQDTPSPRDLVRALALAFLEGPLTDEERLRHHQLIAREMALPTEAFGLLTQQVMRPFFRELADRLRPVLPENMGGEHLMLNIMSIFAMVLHFNFGREAVSRIMGRAYDPEFKQKLVEHIIGFSLRGMGWGDEEGIP